MGEKNFVGRYGLFATIVVTVIGVGIFAYPKDLTAIVGTDGWIVTAIAGIIAFFLLYLIYKVIELNHFYTFNKILERNLGVILGKSVAIIYAVYNIVIVSIAMRIFVEVIRMYLLEKTPTEFILIAMILTGTYLLRGDLNSLVKFNEVGFWIMFIPISIVFLFTVPQSDFTNILPIMQNEPISYVKAVGTALLGFIGFQIAYLILPHIEDRKGVRRTLRRSILFVTIFYVVVVILTLSVFGKEQNKRLLWPTITMIKSIDIQGSFVERWEGIVMALWTMFYFTTFTNMYYFASDLIKNSFKLDDIKLASIVIAPFIYCISLYPQNIAEVYDLLSKVFPIFSILIFVIFPLILIFISKTKGGGTKNET